MGNETARINTQGQRTEYTYDAYRNLIQTTYADGSTETSSYDAEGNRISSTDRAANTTTYAYDALGRLTVTTYPDGSTSENQYNAIGQVIASIDAKATPPNTNTMQPDEEPR